MSFYLSILIFFLVSSGVYCLLQPNIMRIILGIIILSNAGNLIVFVAGGLSERAFPIVPVDAVYLDVNSADSVPQALILTSIVIGFGVTAYLLVLCREFFRESNDANLTARNLD